ncbi:MAG: DUF951 domain-containing protein [Armatimonadetes bacterium]|nr:DUF951 domain-containing protein [Armatimonadota bacterium]
MPIPFSILPDMQVRLKKKHPCGGDTWQVTRTGADIGMLCLTCGRRVFLEREEFERRVKEILETPTNKEMLNAIETKPTL